MTTQSSVPLYSIDSTQNMFQSQEAFLDIPELKFIDEKTPKTFACVSSKFGKHLNGEKQDNGKLLELELAVELSTRKLSYH